MALSQYSFPILDESDMAAFLHDIQFPFRPEWKKPTPQIVSQIYPSLVDIVVGIDKERIAQPEPSQMELHSIHQDVYSTALPEFGMLMMIFETMEACCIHNFSLKDFSHPTWPRLKAILSGVINFLRFTHEFFLIFDSAKDQTAEMEQTAAKFAQVNQHLIQQYNEYIDSPQVKLLKQLQQQEKELQEILFHKKQTKMRLETQCKNLIADLKLTNDHVNSLSDTMNNLKYELDLLKKKDITGLLHGVENLKAKVDVQQNTINTQNNDLVILRSKQDVC